jgi:hypothetical protein
LIPEDISMTHWKNCGTYNVAVLLFSTDHLRGEQTSAVC